MTPTPRLQIQRIKALTGREDAGVDDGDIDATKVLDRGLNRACQLVGDRHVAPDAEPGRAGGHVCDVRVEIETDDGRALLQQELRTGATDA